MNITLKKIAIYHRLSEETTAYNADVYIDGVKSYAASNDGHGGCDFFHPYPGGIRLADPDGLEEKVGRLLAEYGETKRLRGMMRTKMLIIEGGKLMSINRKPTPENLALFKRARPGVVVVNDNEAAFTKAVQLLMAA